MFARITYARLHPDLEGKAEEQRRVEEIFKKTTIGQLREHAGLTGVMLLTNKDGEGAAVTFWETAEQASRDAGVQDRLAAYKDLFAETIVHTGEVDIQERGEQEAKSASLVYVIPRSFRERPSPAVKTAFLEQVLPSVSRSKGFAGAIFVQAATTTRAGALGPGGRPPVPVAGASKSAALLLHGDPVEGRAVATASRPLHEFGNLVTKTFDVAINQM